MERGSGCRITDGTGMASNPGGKRKVPRGETLQRDGKAAGRAELRTWCCGDTEDTNRVKDPTLPSSPRAWRGDQGAGSELAQRCHPAQAAQAAWHSSLSPPRASTDISNNPALIKLDDVSEAIGQARRGGHHFPLNRNTRRRCSREDNLSWSQAGHRLREQASHRGVTTTPQHTATPRLDHSLLGSPHALPSRSQWGQDPPILGGDSNSRQKQSCSHSARAHPSPSRL